MKFVQPIRSKEKIEQMKEELRKRGTRDYIMFLVCINYRSTNKRYCKAKEQRY